MPRWSSTAGSGTRCGWWARWPWASSSAAAIEQFEFFEFVVLNAHIVFPDGPMAGTAVSRLFMCELRQDRASGRWTNAYGIYHDRYRFDDGRWWFAERRYHSLARHGRDLDAFPFPTTRHRGSRGSDRGPGRT